MQLGGDLAIGGFFLNPPPHDEAYSNVYLQHRNGQCVSVKPPLNYSAAPHDSASVRTLQHSALSLHQPDQYCKKEADAVGRGGDTPIASALLQCCNALMKLPVRSVM